MNPTIDSDSKQLLARSGMLGYKPSVSSYVALPLADYETIVVPLGRIEVFERGPGVPNFNVERALAILRAINTDKALPPVEVHALEQQDHYKLYNGFHRYHLSRTQGFCCIPAIVVPPPY